MAKILLTGARGQAGSDIEFALLKAGHTVISATHKTLDISQADHVMSAVLDSRADAVINAAAYSNVEKAGDESSLAYNTNAMGARNLAKACAQAQIPLIHLSTDYVFSDNKHAPHKEDDPTFTECFYGKSKLDGENMIISSGCRYLIVRTSWLFGRFGRNFVKIMLSMAQDRDEIAVVCDQLGNPTPVRPLAEALVKMTEQALKPDFDKFGIYHFCGEDATTWDEFARTIFALACQMNVLSHDVNVISITSNEFKSKAKRPSDSRLDTSKVREVFDLEIPYWPNYLSEVIQSYVRECQGLLPVENYDNTMGILEQAGDPVNVVAATATGPAAQA